MDRNKPLICFLLVISLAAGVSADWVIESPIEKEYNTTGIMLKISGNETLKSINYSIDGDSPTVVCQDCSSDTTMLELAEGDHSLLVWAGNETRQVEFSIVLHHQEENSSDVTVENASFTFWIVKPSFRYYKEGPIDIDVRSNETLDSMSATVGSSSFTCSDCSRLNGSFNLSAGEYVLSVRGSLGDTTIEQEAAITILNKTAKDQHKEIGGWSGFEKLPKTLERGDISDEELSEIIRENPLQPGIINRLIKSGNLGNESIDAILETQFNPPGILRKLLAWAGFKEMSYSELIYNHYNLSDYQEERIVMREDFPAGSAEKVKEKLKEKVKNKLAKQAKGPEAADKGVREHNDTDVDVRPSATENKASGAEKKEIKVVRQDQVSEKGDARRDNKAEKGNPSKVTGSATKESKAGNTEKAPSPGNSGNNGKR